MPVIVPGPENVSSGYSFQEKSELSRFIVVSAMFVLYTEWFPMQRLWNKKPGVSKEKQSTTVRLIHQNFQAPPTSLFNTKNIFWHVDISSHGKVLEGLQFATHAPIARK
jgi:hypothetical protein